MSRARTSPNDRTVKRPATSCTSAMAASATRASTPDASAATAAISALDWLNRPGNASRTGARPPVGPRRAGPPRPARPRASPPGSGRAKPQFAQDQPSVRERDAALAGGAAHGIVLPAQAGAHPVHVAGRAGPPHHQRDRRRSPRRACAVRPPAPPASCPAIMRTSFVRSSWSRDRFSSSDGGGRRRREDPRQVDLVGLEDGARAPATRRARRRGPAACSSRSRCSRRRHRSRRAPP